MKIIQTPARFPPYTGGVEQYTYVLSKRLIERGHEVTVVCANEPEQAKLRSIHEGIEVIRHNYIGKIAQTNITPRLPLSLFREIKDADIVHTHLPTPWTADVSVLIAALCGTPSVVTYHNDIRGEGVASNVADLYNATAMQITLSLTDKIITTTESYFENSKIPRRLEQKVVTIRNGVDVERFSPETGGDISKGELGFESDRTNLFFLSVLDEYHDYKGLENLLGAMRQLPSKYNLVIGGDGSKREYYEEQAAMMGLEDRTYFAGYIPDDQLPAYYREADIFVLPSTSAEQEGFGLVLLEALACGTPVVTTDVVGIADDVRDADIGIVIPDSTPASIADAVSAIVSDGTTINTEQGRHICEDHYSWTEITGQLESLYNQLLV